MKKQIAIILIICLTVLALVFGILWQQKKRSHDDALLLAQSGAKEAHTRFVEYQELGHESDYWAGVSAFYSFERAYYLLVEGTNKSVNFTFCNEVYGALLLSPETSQSHMAEVIEVMALLAENVQDENGYLQMSNLRNLLNH